MIVSEWGSVCFWESAGLGGIVCSLLTHEILDTRQYVLAGLKKVRDTKPRRSEHTDIRPVVPHAFPVTTPPSHYTSSWNNLSFEDFCSAKETCFCTAETSFLIFFRGLDLLKVGTETIQ